MGVYQRRDRGNHWWLEFVYRGRRIRRRSPLQHRRGAEAYERKLRHDLELATASGIVLARARPPRFDVHVERWMRTEVRASNRPSGYREKESILRLHLLPRLASFPLDDITTAEVAKVVSELRASGLSKKTVNNVLLVLRRALAVAVEWGALLAVPKIELLETDEPAWRYLREWETTALLAAAAPGFWRTLILFFLHTGVRFSEAAALEWEHVHLDEERPYVFICKGGSRGVPGPTKSGRSRSVPLSPEVVAALSSHPRRHAYVFPQEKGRPMMDAGSEAKYLYKSCDAAGVKRCGWHVLRHTFGTRLALAGVPTAVIKRLMGHQNVQTTDRYLNVDDGTALTFGSAIQRALPVPCSPRESRPKSPPNGESSPARATSARKTSLSAGLHLERVEGIEPVARPTAHSITRGKHGSKRVSESLLRDGLLAYAVSGQHGLTPSA